VGIRWSQSGEPAVSLPAAAEPSGMLALSISHGGDMAVAVCMRLDQ
jgi:phosphopantetheinyl transferase (holo-ACP synthase)